MAEIEVWLAEVRAVLARNAPARLPLFEVFAREALFARHWLAPQLASLAPGAAVLEVGAGLMLVSCQLQREGYRVALAGDGLQALEQLALETPALVLSDIEMPRMDGFDLLRNLRGDARWAGVPVIMITSRIADKHRELALSLGANHYLGKPYPEDELLGLLAGYTRSAD